MYVSVCVYIYISASIDLYMQSICSFTNIGLLILVNIPESLGVRGVEFTEASVVLWRNSKDKNYSQTFAFLSKP